MSSLNSAKLNLEELFTNPPEGCTVEGIPKDGIIPIQCPSDKNNRRIFCESHTFNCIRFDVPEDKGFTENLTNLIHTILNSDKVLDQNIKDVASSIMKTCIDHNIKRYTDEEVKMIKKINELKKKEKENLENVISESGDILNS